MNKKGYQRQTSYLPDNGTSETFVFDTSSPLLDHDEVPEAPNKAKKEARFEVPEPRVYMAREVQKLLGLGKSKTYEYLEQVYQEQSPFRVIKVGRLYRVPKKSFDAWLDTVS